MPSGDTLKNTGTNSVSFSKLYGIRTCLLMPLHIVYIYDLLRIYKLFLLSTALFVLFSTPTGAGIVGIYFFLCWQLIIIHY